MSSFDIAWEEFPTASTTLVFPIQKAEFPTVTLCQKNNNPDRWGAAIKIFDYLDRSCLSERYKEYNFLGERGERGGVGGKGQFFSTE